MTLVDELLGAARREIGKPYVFGAEGPASFDCSGLMQYVFAKVGIKLPRTAAEQQRYATPISNPQPGDLVFYNRPATHVALYIGGGRMIAAPHAGALVREQAVYSGATYGRVSGLGAGTAAGVGAVQELVAGAGGAAMSLGFDTDKFFKLARGSTLQLVAAAFGLGLIGVGLYRIVAPAIRGAIPGGGT